MTPESGHDRNTFPQDIHASIPQPHLKCTSETAASVRVYYDSDIFSIQQRGGVSRYFAELIPRIKDLGATASLFSGVHINEHITHLSFSGSTRIRVPAARYTGILRRAINRWIQTRTFKREHFDIIHQTYYSTQQRVPHGVKLVVTVHDMIHELFGMGDKTSALKLQACLRADRIIAVSNRTKHDLMDLFHIPPDKIAVIYLASALALVSPASKKCRPYDSPPYLLYVGTRGGYKNCERFFQAFASSMRLRRTFHVVCFGGPPFSRAERARLGDLRIHDRVHHRLGHDADLSTCYQNATALVYPSLYEGFGLPSLEAMSVGCPVICARAGSIPEVVDAAGAYFDPSSADSMRQEMESVLFDSVRLEAMKRAGLLRSQAFSWDLCAWNTFSVYTTLL